MKEHVHLYIFIYGLRGAAFVYPQLRSEDFLHKQENNFVLRVRQDNRYCCLQISARWRSLLSHSWVRERLFVPSGTVRMRVSFWVDAALGTNGKGPGEHWEVAGCQEETLTRRAARVTCCKSLGQLSSAPSVHKILGI